jgi:hypothetical protein
MSSQYLGFGLDTARYLWYANGMQSDRPKAVQTSGRLLLGRLWTRRKEFFPRGVTIDQFLRAAPELLVREILGINLEYRMIASRSASSRIAGFMDRNARLIVIAQGFKRQWQRFTLAHEIGHWMLHTGTTYFRERPISSMDFHDRCRPTVEIEADLFAAELLMPQRTLRAVFLLAFGHEIDGRNPDLALAQSLSDGLPRKVDPHELASMPASRRAALIAQTPFFRGRFIKPLIEHFDVSAGAMAIQLLETGLVR